jgi:hypothetical protein
MYSLRNICLSLQWKALVSCESTVCAVLAVFAHWMEGFRFFVISTPMSLSSLVSSRACPHGIDLAGVVESEVHDLAFFHVVGHPPLLTPLPKVVQRLLKTFSFFGTGHRLSQLGVVGKLSKKVNEKGNIV